MSTIQKTRRASLYDGRVMTCSTSRPKGPMPFCSSQQPKIADLSAAGASGPPRHCVEPRDERQYRGSASRLQSGTPTACGRRRPDPQRRARSRSLPMVCTWADLGHHVPALPIRRARRNCVSRKAMAGYLAVNGFSDTVWVHAATHHRLRSSQPFRKFDSVRVREQFRWPMTQRTKRHQAGQQGAT